MNVTTETSNSSTPEAARDGDQSGRLRAFVKGRRLVLSCVALLILGGARDTACGQGECERSCGPCDDKVGCSQFCGPSPFRDCGASCDDCADSLRGRRCQEAAS